MDSLLFLALLAAIAWFWFDSLRAHEIAKGTIKQLCAYYQLQLVDDTVSLKRMQIQRATQKSAVRFYLLRTYQFEFSPDGNELVQGVLLMHGSYPVFIDLPGYYERVILSG